MKLTVCTSCEVYVRDPDSHGMKIHGEDWIYTEYEEVEISS